MEARRLVTGRGQYTDDITLPGQARAVFLRSPHAHADILSIDKSRAAAKPGVLAILTGEDYAADGLGLLIGPSPLKRRDGSPMFRAPRPALTLDRVRHIGQAVAIVVAETVEQARDAADTISIDYRELPLNTLTSAALNAGALWADNPDNECCVANAGDAAATREAIANAPHVVRHSFAVTRVAGTPIEPRSVVAQYDPGRERFTIYACQQRPYIWRNILAGSVFRISEHSIELIVGDVGGSFGVKGGLYIEVPLVAWASKRIGRPVKWTSDRSEAFLSDDQARDMTVDAELALDRDGTFLALRMLSQINLGAHAGTFAFAPPRGMSLSVGGTYRTPVVFGQGLSVYTNTVQTGNYRAPSRAPGTYAFERLIDLAANELALDAAEIRRRNFVPAGWMPHRMPTGELYDVGEFEAVFDRCLELADYKGAGDRKAEARTRGKLRGVGIASFVDPVAGEGSEVAEVRFDPGGAITVLAGSTAGGQSHETMYKQIVSETLGVDGDIIRVVEGDTTRLHWGSGTGASRTATLGGSAALRAIEKVIAKGRAIAAHHLQTDDSDIAFEAGTFRSSGGGSIGMIEVAKLAFDPRALPAGLEPGLWGAATFVAETSNIPNGCHICEVEIDPDTGVTKLVGYFCVSDVGVEINPLLVQGQIHGGIAQGVGQALMEEIVYDPDTGQLLTGSLQDYALPRALDLCSFVLESHPVPATTNPLGVKGAGECGTAGALAAVMNAVCDALRPLGVRDLAMPASPERVWRAIQDARKRGG